LEKMNGKNDLVAPPVGKKGAVEVVKGRQKRKADKRCRYMMSEYGEILSRTP